MRKTIRSLLQECEQGRPSMLVSIISASGSAPRGAGAHMAVGLSGRMAGTIGGGALEYMAAGKAAAYILEKRCALEEYRLSAGDAESLGMICGGDVDVLYTFVAADDSSLEVLGRIHCALTAHERGWLLLSVDGGLGCMDAAGGIHGVSVLGGLTDVAKMETGIVVCGGVRFFVQPLTDDGFVYVFGAGHLSRELVPLLTHLDFRCIVTDDREQYASAELFPEAHAVHVLSYDRLEGRLFVGPRDFIVAVTRGHSGDYEVEKFALSTPAAYIGIVGSAAKSAALRQRLLGEGYSSTELDRVTSPIGLPIRSETPAEIAVSIAAQLVLRRAELRGERSET